MFNQRNTDLQFRNLLSTDVEALETKQKKLLDGPIVSANIKYVKFHFTNLTKDNHVTGLRGRGFIEDSHKNKQLMEYALIQKFCGVEIVPALYYGNGFKETRNVLPFRK